MQDKQPFSNYINLAAQGLGARAMVCSDDFFAFMDNLVKPGRGVFIADKYTERGKWMDGWESRRKRTPGHDWCVIQLGAPGEIQGVDIDTNHFLGNHPPFASLEACKVRSDATIKELGQEEIWQEILPKSPLNPGSQHFFKIDSNAVYSHVKLHIYPDGGVARLKVYGEVKADWSAFNEKEEVDLVAAINGAKALQCSDMFFSSMDNLLMPGKGINMGDGWETKRNRTPGNVDWLVVKLAARGNIARIKVDTHHFKGNYPDRCSLQGIDVTENPDMDWAHTEIGWQPILPEVKLGPHQEHFFKKELLEQGPFTHVRLCMYPDGGISRLRLWGNLASSG